MYFISYAVPTGQPCTTTHNTPSSDSHLSVMQAGLESLTPGELLKTYGIMHNSDMENLAATHAQDALAFANDVSINGHEIEQRQKHVQTADDPHESNIEESEEKKKQKKTIEALNDLVDHYEMAQLEKERLYPMIDSQKPTHTYWF